MAAVLTVEACAESASSRGLISIPGPIAEEVAGAGRAMGMMGCWMFTWTGALLLLVLF
jgi:hypothetical protein